MPKRNKFLILCIALAIAAIFLQRKIAVDVSSARASANEITSATQTISKVSAYTTKNSQKTEEAELKQNPSINTSEEDPTETDNKDLLCKLKSAHTNVPTQGDIQVFVTQSSPYFGNDTDNVAWIKSDTCPSGTYSIIHFTNEGRVSKEIDCRTTSLTEIATMSGEQGNIKEAPPKNNEATIALSGNGYFVLNCPNKGLLLTRDGSFKKTNEGHLTNQEGCALLNQNGNPFQNFDINESGCNKNQECIATTDPSIDEVQGLKYLNNHSFTAEDINPSTDSVTKTKPSRPYFFKNAREDIHNPERGLTSVAWSNHPYVNLNNLDCP